MFSDKKEFQEKISKKEQNIVKEPSDSERYLPTTWPKINSTYIVKISFGNHITTVMVMIYNTLLAYLSNT